LAQKKTRVLINANKNNLFALRFNQGKLYFEADYKGTVQVMTLNAINGDLGLCTNEVIAAYNPFATNNRLYYVAEVASGKELKSVALNCSKIARSTLESFDYLGDTASDNYSKLPRQPLKDFQKTLSQKFESNEYSEFTGGL